VQSSNLSAYCFDKKLGNTTKQLLIYRINQGLQNFLSEGHTSCYTTVRGRDILRSMILSGYATLY